MKVLINCSYGGFGVSEEFEEELDKRYTERTWNHYDDWDCRSDPVLIALVEEWEAAGKCYAGDRSSIHIVEFPDGMEFTITEYDGSEDLKWELPTNTIVKDLMDIAKGRKKEEETSKFTQMLLKEECSLETLRDLVEIEYNYKKGIYKEMPYYNRKYAELRDQYIKKMESGQ